MNTKTLIYEAVLFYSAKRRENPKAPAKTGIEHLGEFNTHDRAKEVAAFAYEKNKHAYTGYGVMVKGGSR